ncbi:MAG: pilus assembly protein [Planctomyces sp.]|nr:pilus assembly protein [Planctomyces sp.]
MHSPFLRRRASTPDRRRGAAVVETALVLPLFLMVVMGVIEFGRAFMVAQLLTNAAREGARTAITAGSTNAAVTDKVKQLVADSVGVAPGKVTTVISVNNVTGAQLSAAEKRDMCEVEVTVNVSDVTLIPTKFLTGSKLRGQAAMRHE